MASPTGTSVIAPVASATPNGITPENAAAASSHIATRATPAHPRGDTTRQHCPIAATLSPPNTFGVKKNCVGIAQSWAWCTLAFGIAVEHRPPAAASVPKGCDWLRNRLFDLRPCQEPCDDHHTQHIKRLHAEYDDLPPARLHSGRPELSGHVLRRVQRSRPPSRSLPPSAYLLPPNGAGTLAGIFGFRPACLPPPAVTR